MTTLTTRQKETLDFIIQFNKEKGYMPTIREICKGIGVKSPGTVHTHYRALIQKGYIENGKGARVYKLTENPKEETKTEEYWYTKYNKLKREIKDYIYNKEIYTEHFNSKDLLDTSIGIEILEIIERDDK